MDDLYLDNIDEFVNDHNKIVTYKWLSLTLGVHVNQAKQMLFHYLDQKRKESSGSQLHATYLVSGKVVQNGSTSHKVAVVREDQLEDVKTKMDVTVSIHVYSVQKAALKDSGPLYSTDYDAVKENLKNCCKYSAIRCCSAVPTSSEVPRHNRESAPVTPLETEAKKSVLNDSVPPASKLATKQPKGIMGMFTNKGTSKTQESSKEVKTEVNEEAAMLEPSKSKPTLKANNFFGKPASKARTSSEKSEKAIKEEAVGTQASHLAMEASPESPSKAQIKEEEPKSSEIAGKKPKDGKSNKTKRLEQADSEDEKLESRKKKRRRIKKPQHSSSDDDVIADSPPAQDVDTPTPSPENKVKEEPASHMELNSEGGKRRRKRRRVLKSQTFIDEDGCMVTEKAYQSESYSESDDDFKVSKDHMKEPNPLRTSAMKSAEDNKSQKKATAIANKSTKQPSIMGFFQRK